MRRIGNREDELSGGTQDPAAFLEGRPGVIEVLKNTGSDNRVVCVCGEWKLFPVLGKKTPFDRLISVYLLAGQNHLFGYVANGHLIAAKGEGAGNSSGSATEIQNCRAG